MTIEERIYAIEHGVASAMGPYESCYEASDLARMAKALRIAVNEIRMRVTEPGLLRLLEERILAVLEGR